MTRSQVTRTRERLRIGPVLAICMLLIGSSHVALAAESAPGSTSESSRDNNLSSDQGAPWMARVTPDQQAKAQELFDEGRKLFAFPDFIGAEQKFREALNIWNHPAIHYNLALSLRAVENLTLAYEHLEQALKYQGAALSAERTTDANRFLEEIGKKISILELSCREPDTVVVLDGNVVPVMPSRQLLTPGEHHVVAKKAGYEPSEYTLALSPGKPAKLQTRLFTQTQLVRTVYRAPSWIPVAVIGTGAALGVTGALLLYRSNALLKQVDTEFKGRSDCADDGCPLTPAWRELQHDSDLYKTWSTVSFVTGAIAIAGGAIWLPLNKSTKRLTPEELDHQTTVTPIVGANILGAAAAGRF